MFGIGVGEILLILALVVLFMGGKKIPELAKGLGAGIRNFKVGMREDDKRLEEGSDEGAEGFRGEEERRD